MANYGGRPLIILFITTIFSPHFNHAQSCPGLNGTRVEQLHASIYPSNCTAAKVPLGTTCYWVCDKGYGFEDGANTETSCHLRKYNQGPGWTNYNFYNVECKTLTKCPKLDRHKKDNWWPWWCETKNQDVGTVCKHTYCGFQNTGVKQKVCQSNGTWTPVGGAYCRPETISTSVHCPPSFTISTDPGKATADVSAKLSPAISNAPDLQISVERGGDLKALPVGRHDIKYTINTRKRIYAKYCRVDILVRDKVSPQLVRCPHMLLYTVADGLKAKLDVKNEKSEIKFVDGVKGQLSISQSYGPGSEKEGLVFKGSLRSPGNYTMVFYAYDSYIRRNCRIAIRVKSKPCQIKYTPPNGKVSVIGNSFHAICNNGTRSMCDVYHTWGHFDHNRCVNGYIRTLKCSNFILEKPTPGCINETFLKDPVNGTCPNGTVIGHVKPFKCYPCPRSMVFKDKICQVCPANTTNYEFGSATCEPCPKHQMTKLLLAPRFCEDICNPGSWLDSANQTCTKCSRGYYAASGARSCSKCPAGLTTLEEESTKKENCVSGGFYSGNSGSLMISKPNITAPKATTYRLNIVPGSFPSGVANSVMGFRFRSTYLKQSSSCHTNYVRVLAIVNTIEFSLTEKLCGASLDKDFAVGLTKTGLIIEFGFADVSLASLSLAFGMVECAQGEAYNLTSLQCEKCPLNTYMNTYGALKCTPCENGKVTRIEGSVGCVEKCPVGTKKSHTTCIDCPRGYYQDEAVESTSCKKCPNNTITQRSRSTNITDCVAPCAAGQYKSNNGCIPCQIGMFQKSPLHAYKMCEFCAKGRITLSTGANSINSCVVQCTYEGEYYDQRSGTCKKCPRGTYKIASEFQQTECTPCPTNHTTNRVGAASITECIDQYDNCSPNPCKFPGWCEDTGTDFKCHCPRLYTGKLCENRTHACESNPCMNNGTCYNQFLGNQYHCQCVPGFTGTNCESVYHPCKDRHTYCYNNATCTEHGNDYKCNCKPWFTGRLCWQSIPKPCGRYTCNNNGKCTNGLLPNSVPPYTCTCDAHYTGKNCFSKIDYCVNSQCNKAGTMACQSEYSKVGSYRCHCKSGYNGRYCNGTYGCLPGEDYRKSDGACLKCPVGTYQPYRGTYTNCLKCPDRKSTLQAGSGSISHCIGCGVGEYYKHGCKKCERGFYQQITGYFIACKKCGKDQTTFKAGSNSSKYCYDLVTLTKLKVKKFKITNEQWSDDLLNKSSRRYISFAQRLEQACRKVYASEPKYKSIIINKLSKGSVVCDFTIYFSSDVKDPKKTFESSVKSETFGAFQVDKSSFKTVKTDGKHKQPKKKNHVLMAVLIVIGVLVAIGLITFGFIYSRHKSRVRVKFDKMLSNERVTIEYPLEEHER